MALGRQDVRKGDGEKNGDNDSIVNRRQKWCGGNGEEIPGSSSIIHSRDYLREQEHIASGSRE